MPTTVNGIGTSVCGSRGDIGWGSFDAMEWFVIFFMPIVPIKSIHTFDWNGQQYRAIPIKWTFDLVFRTFAGRWLWGIAIAGAILVGIGLIEKQMDQATRIVLFALGGACFAVAVAIGVLLYTSDRRNKDIRRILGPVTVGNCDPAYFARSLRDQVAASTQALYGTDTYGEAVEKLLERGSFAQAMWAARMCVALEDARQGEALTTQILHDPEVIDALAEVIKKANRWGEVMQSDEDRQAPAEVPSQQASEEPEASPESKDIQKERNKPASPRGRKVDDDDY